MRISSSLPVKAGAAWVCLSLSCLFAIVLILVRKADSSQEKDSEFSPFCDEEIFFKPYVRITEGRHGRLLKDSGPGFIDLDHMEDLYVCANGLVFLYFKIIEDFGVVYDDAVMQYASHYCGFYNGKLGPGVDIRNVTLYGILLAGDANDYRKISIQMFTAPWYNRTTHQTINYTSLAIINTGGECIIQKGKERANIRVKANPVRPESETDPDEEKEITICRLDVNTLLHNPDNAPIDLDYASVDEALLALRLTDSGEMKLRGCYEYPLIDPVIIQIVGERLNESKESKNRIERLQDSDLNPHPKEGSSFWTPMRLAKYGHPLGPEPEEKNETSSNTSNAKAESKQNGGGNGTDSDNDNEKASETLEPDAGTAAPENQTKEEGGEGKEKNEGEPFKESPTREEPEKKEGEPDTGTKPEESAKKEADEPAKESEPAEEVADKPEPEAEAATQNETQGDGKRKRDDKAMTGHHKQMQQKSKSKSKPALQSQPINDKKQKKPKSKANDEVTSSQKSHDSKSKSPEKHFTVHKRRRRDDEAASSTQNNHSKMSEMSTSNPETHSKTTKSKNQKNPKNKKNDKPPPPPDSHSKPSKSKAQNAPKSKRNDKSPFPTSNSKSPAPKPIPKRKRGDDDESSPDHDTPNTPNQKPGSGNHTKLEGEHESPAHHKSHSTPLAFASHKHTPASFKPDKNALELAAFKLKLSLHFQKYKELYDRTKRAGDMNEEFWREVFELMSDPGLLEARKNYVETMSKLAELTHMRQMSSMAMFHQGLLEQSEELEALTKEYYTVYQKKTLHIAPIITRAEVMASKVKTNMKLAKMKMEQIKKLVLEFERHKTMPKKGMDNFDIPVLVHDMLISIKNPEPVAGDDGGVAGDPEDDRVVACLTFEKKSVQCKKAKPEPERACQLAMDSAGGSEGWPGGERDKWRDEVLDLVAKIYAKVCKELDSDFGKSINRIMRGYLMRRPEGVGMSPVPGSSIVDPIFHNYVTNYQIHSENDTLPNLKPKDSQAWDTVIEALKKCEQFAEPLNFEIAGFRPTRILSNGKELPSNKEQADMEFAFNWAIDANFKMFATVMGACYKELEMQNAVQFYERYSADFLDPIRAIWMNNRDNTIFNIILGKYISSGKGDLWTNYCLESSWVNSGEPQMRPLRKLLVNGYSEPNFFIEGPLQDTRGEYPLNF